MLGRWVKEHQQSDDGQAFRGNGKLTPDQTEIKKLKQQVKRLEMEKDIKLVLLLIAIVQITKSKNRANGLNFSQQTWS